MARANASSKNMAKIANVRMTRTTAKALDANLFLGNLKRLFMEKLESGLPNPGNKELSWSCGAA